jgi:excisionase family DNA binding protein
MQLMTVQQLADYLQMSADKVYDMVKKREVPAIRIRQQWRFDQREIDAWLKTCSMSEASEQPKANN